MQKNTLLLLAFLTVITVFLITLAVRFQPQKTPISPPQPTQKVVEKTAVVYFSPPQAQAKKGVMAVDIFVNTGGKEITGVQIELLYDPKIVRGVNITNPSVSNFFGNKNEYTVLFKEVNQNIGRASYAIGITPTSTAKNGVGKVAELSFSAVKPATLSSTLTNSSTMISFVEKTMVTREGIVESVLKDTIPLTLTFSI